MADLLNKGNRTDGEAPLGAQLGTAKKTHFPKESRAKILRGVLACIAFAVAGALAALVVVCAPSERLSEAGSYLLPQGSMSDEEAQALLDEQAEASRMTVSVSPSMRLDGDQLRVNFIVVEPNNGLSERLEVEQAGAVVYASSVVPPGYKVEWAQAPQATPGPATATVYAVNEVGTDTGNPVSVEVEIVGGGESDEPMPEQDSVGASA